jgi:Tfp pilus assembly protein PilO
MGRLFDNRRWIYLALALVLTLDMLVIFGWIRNPDLVADADPAQVAGLEGEVEVLRAEAARLERIQTSVPQMGANANNFKAEWFLGDRDGYRRISEDLSAAARDSGVALTRFSGSEDENPDQPGLKRIEVASNIEGSYAGLLQFMDNLERLPQIYLLTELNLVESDGGQIQVRVTLVTYFRRVQA